MSFDWLHYIDMAQELFRQSSVSSHKDADLRCSISRAYYGTFHRARHRLYDRWGILVPKTASAHSQVRKEFKDKGHWQIAANLNRMRIDRNLADYEDSVPNLDAVARENLKRANQVILALKQIQ
ncbi:MAG: hypothetical protein M3Y39_18555 [Chloroflexota bacterium]|nr:hypothetical protein [Chloroflexota bacterium]